MRSGELKVKMSDGREKNLRTLKENVMKMIYIEMLGQNADFGHMEAVRLVNMPNQKSILLKRIGYLAASLVLHDQDQLVILLVNTCVVSSVHQAACVLSCSGCSFSASSFRPCNMLAKAEWGRVEGGGQL